MLRMLTVSTERFVQRDNYVIKHFGTIALKSQEQLEPVSAMLHFA